MTCDVTATQLEPEVFQVNVTVRDDAGLTVCEGETTVCVADEAQAKEYGERVFLPDLRRNMKALASLTFPWEVTPDDSTPE